MKSKVFSLMFLVFIVAGLLGSLMVGFSAEQDPLPRYCVPTSYDPDDYMEVQYLCGDGSTIYRCECDWGLPSTCNVSGQSSCETT